jgi:hypothetical protein
MNKLLLLMLATTCIAPLRLNARTNAVPDGSKFFACFVGRTPCREIANEIGASVPDQCHKLKWDITLFQDKVTGAPTTYRIDATLYRQSPRMGKWKIVSATRHHPNAIIYELEAASGPGSIQLLKADNIMFFVGQNGRLMVGNADFSYTLNRADEK